MSGKRLHNEQSGMVSILVTMLMMVVISLIVLGFAQISRREQRQSLDSQLSTQAYYAAESGINDARQAILTKLGAGGGVPDKTTCPNDANYTLAPDVDLPNSVSYSCLLIDASPSSLSYTIGSTSAVVPIVSSGAPFGAAGINLSWTMPAGEPNKVTDCYTYGSLGQFPPASGWDCPYGVLQIDIVPLPVGVPITRAALTATTKTAFFEPVIAAGVPGGGDNFSMAASPTGKIVAGKCLATTCTATIKDLPANRYYLRITSTYKAGFGLTISSPSGVGFQDAQAVIDATGKAQDVLRRVRVAVDLTDANATNKAGAALITGDSVCKRFSVADGYYSNGSPVDYPGGTGNILCEAGTSGSLTSACNVPHDIILVLDASGSMKIVWETITRLQELQKVATTFVDTSGVSVAGNHVAIVSFNKTPKVEIPFSSSIPALETAIAKLTSNPGTSYIAGLTGGQAQFASARPGIPKVMIFISDGRPDIAGETDAQIIALSNVIKAQNIKVFTVGIVGGDGNTNLLSSMASAPPASYYTLASTQLDFESYFASLSSKVLC